MKHFNALVSAIIGDWHLNAAGVTRLCEAVFACTVWLFVCARENGIQQEFQIE